MNPRITMTCGACNALGFTIDFMEGRADFKVEGLCMKCHKLIACKVTKQMMDNAFRKQLRFPTEGELQY